MLDTNVDLLQWSKFFDKRTADGAPKNGNMKNRE